MEIKIMGCDFLPLHCFLEFYDALPAQAVLLLNYPTSAVSAGIFKFMR